MPVWRHGQEVICRVLETSFDCQIGQRHLGEDDEDFYLVITRGSQSAFLFVKEFEVVPAALSFVANRLGIDFTELCVALDEASEP